MAGTFVLKPYERRREAGPFVRFMRIAAVVGLAAFYGLLCSVLPMQLLVIPLVPILVLVGLILWMMPDIGGLPLERMQTLMLWFIGLGVVWPNYVAFDLPGLPWITPVRIVVFSLLGLVVFSLATSGEFREKIGETLDATPALRKLFWAFWGLTTLSIVFSSTPFFSMNKYINNQIFWTMMFVVSAILATGEGFVMRLSRILVATLFVVMVVGIYEYKIQRVFWIDQLPGFLRVDPEFLDRVARSQARAGTDVYRVRSTFATSLYFAEYLAMVFPLALHFMVTERRFTRFVPLAAGVAGTMVVMYLTNARSAMAGMLLTLVIYTFFAAYRRWKLTPQSIGATATLMLYPAMVLVVSLLVVFWHRAHVLVLGGGQHAASSEARNVQWAIGIPKVISHPFGHGVARSAEVLGYANGAGELTIDTYYLSVLLDYGFLGLPVFMLLFGLPLWLGFKSFIKARTPEAQLVGPLVIGLFSFIVIKAVLSSEGNLPLAFVMLGCVIGLIWQQKRAEAAEAGSEPAEPAGVPQRA